MFEMFLMAANVFVWLESHALIAGAAAAVLLAPGAVCCWAAYRMACAARQDMLRIDQRLTKICQAVELLTDTTESAMQSALSEVERFSVLRGLEARRRAGVTQRVKRAAKRGQSSREIAQREGLSEGEVRLRLRLNGVNPAPVQETPAMQNRPVSPELQ